MDFAFSEEQDEFRDTLRHFLEQSSPSSEVRRLMETAAGYDAASWKRMADELGLQGLHIPEELGGQGFSTLEVSIALEEMGRVLLCAPYFSSVVLGAGSLLEVANAASRRELLPGIAAAETIATLALLEEKGSWALADSELVARPDGPAYRLSGTKTPVLDGHIADLILVVARLPETSGDEGLCLLAVRGDASGLRRELLETLDLTRKQARLDFDDVPARAVGTPGSDGPALARALDQAAALLASESAGGAQRCLDMAVDYAKLRMQFGRPIGSFQAIKHRCADILMEVEAAKAAAHWAAWVCAELPEQLAEAANIAQAVSSDAYVQAAEGNMHVHGGMGFTWEADPQLYVKRARTNEALFGDARTQRARLAARMGV